MNFGGMGKALVIAGGVPVRIGLVFMARDKIPWIGRLPGDIYRKRDGLALYFPLTTSIIISIILTLVFVLFRK